MSRLIRYLWAGPATAVGLVFVSVTLRSGHASVVDGVLEVHGPLVRWALTHLTLIRGGVAAITLGHVVLGTDRQALERTRAHERVHVRQYERWGPLFIPAYVAASTWAVVRGGHAYFDNPFEQEAWRVG